MSEWKEYRLGDILSIKSGFSYKGKYIGTGESLLLGMGCVSFREKFLMSGARPYSGPYDDRYKVYPGDIVLATRQQSDNLPILAMPAMVPNSLEGKDIVIGTNLYKVEITDKSFPNDYIYWLLKTKRYVNYIAGVKTGTTVSMVTKKNVEDFTFFASTNPEERKEIASVIAFLDDKIAVNRRICENLEAQAQALFKHWFIDFAPFKNGKFIETELGMIPKGWRVGRLGDIADINPTRSIKKGEVATYLDMKNMPTSGSFPTAWEKKEFAGGMKFKNGDTLMARITPCLENGKVAFVNFLDDQEIAFGSTEYIVMTAKDMIFPELLYTLCRFPSFVSYATKNMNGSSGRQRVSGETIADYKMVIAPNFVYSEVMPLFHDYMCQIRECGFENLRLSTLRDTLLPKLMSGQIKL